jgi:hypothetical protein
MTCPRLNTPSSFHVTVWFQHTGEALATCMLTWQSKLDTRNNGLNHVTPYSIGDVNTPPVCGHLYLVMQKEVRRTESERTVCVQKRSKVRVRGERSTVEWRVSEKWTA